MANPSIFETILNITAKTIILGVFIFAAGKQILYWLWLWQLKEYRADRLLAHLELFPTKKQKILLFLGYYGFKTRRMPKFTKKAVLLAASISLFYALFVKPVISLSYLDSILTFLLLYLLIPVLVWIFIDAISILASYEKERIIKQATEKIKSRPDLLIIGITGSYGKSSTKEILYEILSGSKKFSAIGESLQAKAASEKILKTPKNTNTPIGIAQMVLSELKDHHKIFIVEMGAYKKGEIGEICKITPPKIGILTGINEQHLALFGNLQKTAAAKFELISSLPADGLAVLNIDNVHIKEKIKNLSAADYKNIGALKEKISRPIMVKNIINYSATEKADIYSANIDVKRNALKLDVVFNNEKVRLYAPLSGAQNIYNILAASAVALTLGITLEEIAEIIKNVSSREKTMSEYEGKNGSFLIADTYNSNPNGIMAALDYLNVYSGKKIIVFGGIIELGRASQEIHRKIGAKIAEHADLAILTNPVFAKYIKEGALANNMPGGNIIIETSKNSIYDIVNNNTGAEDIVLFCGRGGQEVLEKLKK